MGSENLQGHLAVIQGKTTFLITNMWFYLEIRLRAYLDLRYT